jgi:hypothetical protein
MTSQALAQVVQQAREQAKTILAALEQTGHPQTNESSGLYLALVSLQKRLGAPGAMARAQELTTELQQLAALCKGKLEPLKALLDQAVRIVQGRAN